MKHLNLNAYLTSILSLFPALTLAATITSAATTCSFTPIPSPPAVLHCGQTGQLNASQTDFIAAIRVSPKASNPVESCRSFCAATPHCISFSYQASTYQCLTYDQSLRNQGFTQGSSGPVFYNKRCFRQSCPSKTSTISSSSLSTTTSSISPTTPVCTPTQTNLVQNGGFESTFNGNSPSWSTSGNVNFIDNSNEAYAGNYFADLQVYNYYTTSSLSQTFTNLDTTANYILNFTFYVADFNTYRTLCGLNVQMSDTGNIIYRYYDDGTQAGAAGAGYFFQYASYQPQSNTSTITFALECQPTQKRDVEAHVSDIEGRNTEAAPFLDIYVDNIAFSLQDDSCAMYVQVVPDSGPVDSQYLYVESDGRTIGFTSALANATQLSLDPYGHVFSIIPGYGASYWYSSQYYQAGQIATTNIWNFDLSQAADTESEFPRTSGFVLCSITSQTFLLTCSVANLNLFYDNNAVFALGNSSSTASGPFDLQITYVNPG